MRISDWSSDVCSSDLKRVAVEVESVPLRRQGERAATIERLGILADPAMGGAIALLSTPEALHLPRQGHDVAVAAPVRIARRAGDGRLINAAAAELVAPVAERACEQPRLTPRPK